MIFDSLGNWYPQFGHLTKSHLLWKGQLAHVDLLESLQSGSNSFPHNGHLIIKSP